ncbi:hypothetical protein SEMRO_2396_G326020.1 [Seminavis robusta]|uniref:Uncharacterized protein n=1 Tax=Seminavis robusta TaxID=568900 RepID=A0A9N8HVR1_9STRA|nr:hypothetical protein SEMRO_2396_G326020.1 [Seminavis robusta]|eukprot:Sro2396_g326020.1 n/a (187) ;mRNA; r:10333-10893
MVNFNTKDLKVAIYNHHDDNPSALPDDSVNKLMGALEWAFEHSRSHKIVFSFGYHYLTSDAVAKINSVVRKHDGKIKTFKPAMIFTKADKTNTVSVFYISGLAHIFGTDYEGASKEHVDLLANDEEKRIDSKPPKKPTAKPTIKPTTKATRKNARHYKKYDDSDSSSVEDVSDQGLTQELYRTSRR